MVKGGKRYSSAGNDGKWFAHAALPECETRSRETCTSTGIMLNQVKTSVPQALNLERYPKWKSQQKSRDYPLSSHDNKIALTNDVTVFSQGAGRRKCPEERRQNNSHFCLCRVGADGIPEETRRELTTHQADFTAITGTDVPNKTRRFPHNHKLRSAEAAMAQAEGHNMWFGRHDSNVSKALNVVAATECSSSSQS
ncbi:testis-expressed protein 36 [Menidia menidia]